MRHLLKHTWLLLILFTACTMARFDHYPGVVQKQFPEQLQGNYYLTLPKSWRSHHNTDTLYYTIAPTYTALKDSTKSDVRPLGDKQVLTLVNNRYYVLSFPDNDYPNYWNCMVYLPEKNGISIYPTLDEGNKSKLHKYFKRTFVTLKDNGDSSFVYQIDDTQFERYVEELKRNQVIKLKKQSKTSK